MQTLTASEARANLYRLIDETAQSHEPIIISGSRTRRGTRRWSAILRAHTRAESIFSIPSFMRSSSQNVQALLSPGTPPDQCPDGARLLAILGSTYGTADEGARRRALQRDLSELVMEGRIAPVNPGGKPLRYRRVADEPDEDPAVWAWTMQTIHDLAAEAVPRRQFERLWQRLLPNTAEPRLDEARLRIVPDTFRLQPVELRKGVLKMEAHFKVSV